MSRFGSIHLQHWYPNYQNPEYIYPYSGYNIQDIYAYIYIPNLCNLGTNVANGSIPILTLDISSRIYMQILVIWVPMLQMDRSEYWLCSHPPFAAAPVYWPGVEKKRILA